MIAIWSEATEEIANAMFGEMEAIDKEGKTFNPVYVMADSGARGSEAADSSAGRHARLDGETLGRNRRDADHRELPRRPRGAALPSRPTARKGLADTALKTAGSGYLTRRLVDVAQT